MQEYIQWKAAADKFSDKNDKDGAAVCRRLMMVCALLLGGCAMTTPISYTDGKPAQFVECSASASWSVCFAEANSACPKGYSILQQREQTLWANKALTIRCQGAL